MDSPHRPQLTSELLRAFSSAALRNAEELLVEASLLNKNRHFARAYFLATSCIEEVGKALQAHDAQRRNLSDPAVCSRLIAGLESHPMKINYALTMWGLSESNQIAGLQAASSLIHHLKRGREPSMYSDIRPNPDRAQVPSDVVRPEAASDCIRLAEHCIAYASRHVQEKEPLAFTRKQDMIFTMKEAKFRGFLDQEDFWWFFISRLENGDSDLAEAIFSYETEYTAVGRLFKGDRQAS